MIATDLKLIPLAELTKHEGTVLRSLDSLPVSYVRNLLEEPAIRRAFLIYVLLTHRAHLLNGGLAEDELIANRLYWYFRFSKQYEAEHDFEAGYELEAVQLKELAAGALGRELVAEIEQRVTTELASKEWEIAVAFSDFSIGKVKGELGVQLDEGSTYFSTVAPVPVSSLLVDTLKSSLPLALKINTEKARSELIVAPVLMEVYRQLGGTISLFSGVDWEVDSPLGLCGRCDFLMSRSPEQLRIEAPVLAIVEAKKDDISAGIAQCLAEMVAARIFNHRAASDIQTIYGAVTTGSAWRFLRLVESTAHLDETEYYINDAARIVGILTSMFATTNVANKG